MSAMVHHGADKKCNEDVVEISGTNSDYGGIVFAPGGQVMYNGSNHYIVITNAAQEGARYGSLDLANGDGIEEAVIREAAGSDVTIEPGVISISGLNAGPGERIEVEVAHRVPVLFGRYFGAETDRRDHPIIPFESDAPPRFSRLPVGPFLWTSPIWRISDAQPSPIRPVRRSPT